MADRTRHAVLFTACLALVGCDKLKTALGKGDAADAASSASSSEEGSGGLGSGALSFLGGDFEGEISGTFTTASKAAPQPIVFGIKKPKYRVEISGATPGLAQGGTFIVDPAAKKGWVLAPAQKLAMVIDFEKVKSMPQLPGMPPKSAPAAPPNLEKTGKKDVVAGYSCEVWNVTSEGRKAEACVAEGITWVDLSDLGWSSPEMTLAAAASGANRFPLRVITFDAKGAEETRMEATKIEKRPLDAARFSVPDDYRVIDMSAIGGFGAIPGGPNLVPKTPR